MIDKKTVMTVLITILVIGGLQATAEIVSISIEKYKVDAIEETEDPTATKVEQIVDKTYEQKQKTKLGQSVRNLIYLKGNINNAIACLEANTPTTTTTTTTTTLAVVIK